MREAGISHISFQLDTAVPLTRAEFRRVRRSREVVVEKKESRKAIAPFYNDGRPSTSVRMYAGVGRWRNGGSSRSSTDREGTYGSNGLFLVIFQWKRSMLCFEFDRERFFGLDSSTDLPSPPLPRYCPPVVRRLQLRAFGQPRLAVNLLSTP